MEESGWAILGIGMMIAAGVILVISLIVGVLFLLNLHRLLDAIKPANRTMEPGLVWLNLIPIFNLGWLFYTVIKISEALGAELAERGLDNPDEGGKVLGLVMAGTVVGGLIPLLGGISSLAALVVGIIYWIKMAEYRKKLV